MRASGSLHRELRVGLTMAWVAFLQGMHLTYGHSDLELQNYALQAMSMLTFNSKVQIDAHCQACVLYILCVGVVEQMSEAAQKEFLTLLTKQLSLADTSSSMMVVILRTISHLLIVLGEVSSAAREALENSLVVTLSDSTMAVRVETALTIRALAEVDPFCVNSLLSFGVITMRALRESLVIETGDRLKQELDSLYGQALMLGAILAATPKLPLGIPSRLPAAILELAKSLVLENGRNLPSVGVEREAGWLLVAAVLSSMTKKELREQEFDIIALWTVPFGGNLEVRVKGAESNLQAEICGWSAAVEALTAFIKSYVVPNMSTEKEGILLQPVLGYLNGALAYISSPTLQQVSSDLKLAVDTFLMRTLMAYHALPDPFSYKSDHNVLLGICSAPFRDPGLWGESTSLRQLLDQRDASLGPWTPGRDSFEDELRAFEGGSDGPLPCVWENDTSVFPQPLSVSALLLNQVLLCFGSLFLAQKETKKLQLLDILEESMKLSKKQSFYAANVTNVCVALLAALKETLRVRGPGYEADVFRRLQLIFQGIMAEETSTTAQRRAAAEGLGVLARLGNDVFAARLMRSLLTDATSVSDVNLKASIAFALGCIHRSKGGMALSVLVPATVQILCAMARDPRASLHRWALHGLWLTAEASGLAFVPRVQATMALAMDALLSEEHASPDLQQSVGRLVNAIVAVVGPELSLGSSFFSRCKAIVAEITSGEEPAALLESVLFTQQLVLFAPQAVSFHTHVQTLTPTLWSKQPSLRQAAVSTLRHLAERDPISMIDERIEEKLFAMLDTETDQGIIKLVRLTLLCLLEAACPLYASRWLLLCRNVVLAMSSTIDAGNKKGSVDGGSKNAPKVSGVTEAFGEDEEGMIEKSGADDTSLQSSEPIERKTKEGDHLPRYSTRLFAAECLSRLPMAVGGDPRHFNLFLAREGSIDRASSKPKGDWLVNQLGQLVALAYQVATGVFEKLRPKGVMLLVTILRKFEDAEDPDFSGHLLLEQYQAQFVSAVRTALDINAGPLLLDAGLQLAARIITSGICNGDATVFRRVLTLISRLLHNFEDLQFPSYAEWVGCKVQVSLLSAYAAVKSYAQSCLAETSDKYKEGLSLMTLMVEDYSKLRRLWIDLLRDYTVLQMYTASQLQAKYRPFLGGLLLPTVVVVIQPYLDEVWPVVFEAVTSKLVTDTSVDPKTGSKDSSQRVEKMSDSTSPNAPLSVAEFHQLWVLCFSVLSQSKKRSKVLSSKSSFCAASFKVVQSGGASDTLDRYHVMALRGIEYLCVEGLEKTSLLTSDLCVELFQVFMCPKFKSQLAASFYIMPTLKQMLNSSPDEHFLNEEWTLASTEACLHHAHQLLCSADWGTPFATEVDATIGICFEALEILVQRCTTQIQSKLLPLTLMLALKFAMVAPATGNSLSFAMKFILGTTTMLFESVDEKGSTFASVLESFTESISILAGRGCGQGEKHQDIAEGASIKLLIVMESLLELAQTILDSKISSLHESVYLVMTLDCCLKCLRLTLTASDIEVQVAGLQTLRNVAQRAIAENKQGTSSKVALLLMRELGAAIVTSVYDIVQNPLTAKEATLVGERLKLLVLLQSLVEGDEAQKLALHILLPVIVAAASPNSETDSQITAGLRILAVKLITHLATQPDCAGPFRSVVSEMPPDGRQKLQEIIRASMSQQTSTPIAVPAFPVAAPKLVISSLPVSSTSNVGASLPVTQPSTTKFDMEEDDDDWDDFQSHPTDDAAVVSGAKAADEELASHTDNTFEEVGDSPLENDLIERDEHDFDSFQGGFHMESTSHSNNTFEEAGGYLPENSLEGEEDDFDSFQGGFSTGVEHARELERSVAASGDEEDALSCNAGKAEVLSERVPQEDTQPEVSEFMPTGASSNFDSRDLQIESNVSGLED